METLYYFVLGLVQGLTEFLPVSSSGHLVLVNKLFENDNNFLFLSILLHVATLISVCVALRKEIFELLKHPFSKQALNFVYASICSVVVVVIFNSFFKSTYSGEYLSICFMITAIILMLAYFKTKSNSYHKYNSIKWNNALVVGVVQGFAALPGISRSGSTISSLVFQNIDSETATNFSFILSLPIIVGSLIFEIYDCASQHVVLFNGSYFNLFLGFSVACVSGIFAIKLMKKVAKMGKYFYFAIKNHKIVIVAHSYDFIYVFFHITYTFVTRTVDTRMGYVIYFASSNLRSTKAKLMKIAKMFNKIIITVVLNALIAIVAFGEEVSYFSAGYFGFNENDTASRLCAWSKSDESESYFHDSRLYIEDDEVQRDIAVGKAFCLPRGV